ncbi:MAG: tetratricopeptide repeat protein [Deltaproteobacteria bacterium]|nr:MAG: tetratricopeptide repeat protein [Deltaproteobacteria bacterium]
MSDARRAVAELRAVLDTAHAQLDAVFGLTLGFDDGLAIRLGAIDRANDLLHRSGFSSSVLDAKSAVTASDDDLLAVIGVPTGGGAAPARTPAPPAARPQAVEVEPEPVDVEPVDLDPVELEPEPVDIEPVDLDPVELEPEPVDVEPVALEPIDTQPQGMQPLDGNFGPVDDTEDDATQLFTRGAIPVDWGDDDEEESTQVMDAGRAREMLQALEEPEPAPTASIPGIEDDHFDLVAPEELEPEPLEELDEVEEIDEVEELPHDEDTDETPMERFYEQRAAAATPQVRAASERPGAAAIQLGAEGGPRVMAPEEDEEIAVEAAPDEDDYDFDSEGGFAVNLEEDEYEEYEEEEEAPASEPEPEPEPKPKAYAPPPGPSPEVIQGFIDRAKHELSEGGLEAAALSFTDALDGDARNGEVRLQRGRIYMDMGDYSRAVSDFLLAEEIFPNSAEPQVLMGELYSHRKDYSKAINYLDIALRLDPRHPMAYYRRGLAHMKTKEYNKAVDDLGRARALDEDLPGIDHFLGQAMKKAGR